MIRVCETGRNPTMRHLGRTHRVSVSWLHERFSEPQLTLVKEPTDIMFADIFTKGFANPDKWDAVCALINIRDPTKPYWTYQDPCMLGGGRVDADDNTSIYDDQNDADLASAADEAMRLLTVVPLDTSLHRNS